MRLIDADKLQQFPIRANRCDKEHANTHFINGIESVMEYAELLPTVDAVPVVRCKDCKHAEPYKRTDGATGYYCHCKYNVFEYGDRRKYTPVRASGDYCSYGEREENNGVD